MDILELFDSSNNTIKKSKSIDADVLLVQVDELLMFAYLKIQHEIDWIITQINKGVSSIDYGSFSRDKESIKEIQVLKNRKDKINAVYNIFTSSNYESLILDTSAEVLENMYDAYDNLEAIYMVYSGPVSLDSITSIYKQNIRNMYLQVKFEELGNTKQYNANIWQTENLTPGTKFMERAYKYFQIHNLRFIKSDFRIAGDSQFGISSQKIAKLCSQINPSKRISIFSINRNTLLKVLVINVNNMIMIHPTFKGSVSFYTLTIDKLKVNITSSFKYNTKRLLYDISTLFLLYNNPVIRVPFNTIQLPTLMVAYARKVNNLKLTLTSDTGDVFIQPFIKICNVLQECIQFAYEHPKIHKKYPNFGFFIATGVDSNKKGQLDRITVSALSEYIHLLPKSLISKKAKDTVQQIAEYKSFRDIEYLVPSSMYKHFNTDGPLILTERSVYKDLQKNNAGYIERDLSAKEVNVVPQYLRMVNKMVNNQLQGESRFNYQTYSFPFIPSLESIIRHATSFPGFKSCDMDNIIQPFYIATLAIPFYQLTADINSKLNRVQIKFIHTNFPFYFASNSELLEILLTKEHLTIEQKQLDDLFELILTILPRVY